MTQEMTKAAAVLTRYLAKSLSKATSKGEGSRGGKIIGHTKSGKPVYAGTSHTHYGRDGFKNQHKHFTRQDHLDAINLHDAASEHHGENGQIAAYEHEGLTGESGYRSTHHDSANGSNHAGRMHRQAVYRMNKGLSKATSRGEGSRGGKVVAHTRSGKPIYSTNSYMDLHSKGAVSGAKNSQSLLAENRDKVLAKNPKWTAADHSDASAHHSEHSSDYGSESGHYDGPTHSIAQAAHFHAARYLEAKGKTKKSIGDFMEGSLFKASGEGSRGGKVIAHTKSGKPIYAPGHVRHELMNSNNLDKQGHYLAMTHRKYTAQDHADASDHYEKLRDADDHGPERLKLHKIALSHHSARLIKESGEHDAIRNTGKKGSKPATAAHWAAANHFNKKFSTDAARHEIDRTSKSLAKSKGEGSRGGKIIGHTRSNKPIYESSHESYHTAAGKEGKSVHETMKTPGVTAITKVAAVMKHTHPNWSQEDHEDAKIVHGGKGQGGMGDAHAFAASIMNRRRVFADERVARNAQAKRVKAGKVTKSEGNGLDDNLFKSSGEGSRGGKIIGHTKSSKPIYATHKDYKSIRQASSSFGHHDKDATGYLVSRANPNFTKKDHLEAAQKHAAEAALHEDAASHFKRQGAMGSTIKPSQVADQIHSHKVEQNYHQALSMGHVKASRRSMGKSEGNGLDISDLTPSLLEAHSPDDFNTQAAAISGATMWGPTVVAGAGSH